MTVFDGKVLFNGVDVNGLSGLWVTDGTAGGTHEVVAEAAGASSGLDPTAMIVLGNEVLFSGLDAAGHSGLWVTDGTASGTRELLAEQTGATAAKDAVGLSPNDFTVFDGEVFFFGFDQFGRGQLWETNGINAAGTQVLTVADASTTFGLSPLNLEVYNGQLLFQGLDNQRVHGLWTTDGTAAGTQEITPTSVTFQFAPSDLTDLTPGAAVTPPTVTGDIFWQNTSSGQGSIWDMDGSTLVGGGPVSPNPGPSWTEIGTGDFNHDGHADILWQNASGQASVWDMNGNSLIGGGPVSPNPGPAWKAIGTGDFIGDGTSRHPVAEHEQRPSLDLGNERE